MNTTLHGFTEHGFTELEYRRIYEYVIGKKHIINLKII